MMSSPMEGEEVEEYPGVSGDTWNTAYLTRLSALLAKHSILLQPSAGSHTLAFNKCKRQATQRVARALAPPLLAPRRLQQLVDRFTEIYLAKRAEIVRGRGAAHAPAWVRAVEPHLRHAAAPDPAEGVLRALTERARALRTTDPEAVCRSVGAAPRARPEHLERVWARMVAGARAKLEALIAGGDSEAGLQAGARLSRGEWRLVDALLLHDTAGTLPVVREEHARRAEPLRALVAVFHLVQLYRLEEGEGAGRARGGGGGGGGWRAAAAAYRRRGRLASAVLLQRRWHDLKMQTRRRLAAASQPRGGGGGGEWRAPAPLHLAVARRFPQVAVAPLPPWPELVASGAVVEECDLTQDVTGPDELPAEGGGGEEEDDLILVEREIETVDLLTADDDADSDEQVESAPESKIVVKREAGAPPEDGREVLRARRRLMALALERELDRQLRDLDGGLSPLPSPSGRSPLVIYDSEEEAAVRVKEEIAKDESGDDAEDEAAPGRAGDEAAPGRAGDEAAPGRAGDEPAIDPKLLMATSVPLVRVDDPAWREPAPPRPRPPLHRAARALVDELLGGSGEGIRIVSIKCTKPERSGGGGGEEEGGRRGRIRLPDIAEVRRINSSMKTAQVAPLVALAGDESSGEGELRIDEGEQEGGVMTSPELRRVLRACAWGAGGGAGAGAGGTRWRELYCCAARYHRALNDARRRCAARAGRPEPADAPVHAARCGGHARGECRCCCVHLLDAEGAARALAADRERLLHDVRAILAGTYDTEEPEASAAPPCATKAKKKKRNCNRTTNADPGSEPAADPLQEWIRQKNLTSRFFDLNLKKPEKTPKPTEPPPPPPPPPEPPRAPSAPAIAPVMTLSIDRNSRNRTVNKVKVTVKTGAGTSSRSLLLRTVGGSGGRGAPGGTTSTMKRALAADSSCREPAKQARTGGPVGLPPNAIPVTMLQTTGGVRLVPVPEPVLTPAPLAPFSTGDVIDLCDDEPSPPPGPPPAPLSHALLGKLPAGISVRRREVTPPRPPAPDARAREILSGLPPGIRVVRRGAPPVVLLNERMPSAPCVLLSPSKKGNADIKVFKISKEGLLTPAGVKAPAGPRAPLAPHAPRAGGTATKIVLIPRKSGSGGATPPPPPRLLNTLLAASGAPSGGGLDIAEIRRSKNGRRAVVMFPAADERPPAAAPAPAGSTIFTPISTPPNSAPLVIASTPAVVAPSITPDASKPTPARVATAAAEPPLADLATLCSFEVLSDETEPDGPPDGGAAVTLQGGAVVRPARPSHDFSDLTITVEEWKARGGAPPLQVMERGAAPYWAGEYYVRTGRPLPLTRAAVWTTGPARGCARLALARAPGVRREGRAYYLRLAGGAVARAEWVCRSARDVARAARAGARLSLVHAPTGRARAVHCVRPHRPGLLALRCEFLSAALQITQDVNQTEVAEGSSPSYVRIAPRPTPAPAPAPASVPTSKISPLKSGQSLLMPMTPERAPAPPERAPAPPERATTPPERAATPPERAATPPEPARRSCRRAAHDARAKLNDIMKQDSSHGGGGGGGGGGGEGADSGESDSGLDFSSAAGLEPADSDSEYDAAADLRRERGRARRPRPPRPPRPRGEGDDMELDDDVYGGIIA